MKASYTFRILGIIFLLLGVIFLTLFGALYPYNQRMTDSGILAEALSIEFAILGAVFALIGLSFLLIVLRRRSLKKKLQRDGIPVTAQVTSVRALTGVRVNNRTPYVVKASCLHPYTQALITVKSEWLLERPNIHEGAEVQVLVDPLHERRCVMLTESL